LSLKDHWQSSRAFVEQAWEIYHVKETDNGPMVWEAKRVTVTLKDENDLPGMRLELLVCRDVQNREKVKYFVSNVSPEKSTNQLLLVGLTRWHVETGQAHDTSSERWCGAHSSGYHPRLGAA
jgi:hypothetical protein